MANSKQGNRRDRRRGRRGQGKKVCPHWAHTGNCAFVGNPGGCKFVHEMPRTKREQEAVGLSNGLPAWFKQREAEKKHASRAKYASRAKKASRQDEIESETRYDQMGNEINDDQTHDEKALDEQEDNDQQYQQKTGDLLGLDDADEPEAAPVGFLGNYAVFKANNHLMDLVEGDLTYDNEDADYGHEDSLLD